MNWFRPCIDLHEGKVKQLVGSTLYCPGGVQENFVSSRGAAYYARLYRKHRLLGGHIIILGEQCREENEQQARAALAVYPNGFSVGGGITLDRAREWLDAGAKSIVFTSFLFPGDKFDVESFQRILKVLPREQVIFNLNVLAHDGKYFVADRFWRNPTDFEISKTNLAYLSQAAHEFLVHAVGKEGRQHGIDLPLIQKMHSICPIDWVYAGGISALEEIKALKELNGVSAEGGSEKNTGRIFFTVGSGLDVFGGGLSYQAVMDICKE